MARVTAPFEILPADPARLAFVRDRPRRSPGPRSRRRSRSIVVDAFGNRVTSSTASVTLALGNNPGGMGTLGGALVRAAVGGVAT
ncbi:MAG: hypothetical protein HS111_16820 [Kofleriaceae bacterium]|nr:hypothetical protein [Kofleriaceae bacterium]